MKVLGIACGILTGILGICAMTMPLRTFLGIGWLLGAMFVVYGIQYIIVSLKKEKKDVLGCALGVISVIAGIAVLFSGMQRLLTDVMVVYLVGFCIIVYGVGQIVVGFKKEKKDVLHIVLGVISVIAGIIALSHPFMTMFSIGYIIAASLIIQGIDMIVLALALKKEEE